MIYQSFSDVCLPIPDQAILNWEVAYLKLNYINSHGKDF